MEILKSTLRANIRALGAPDQHDNADYMAIQQQNLDIVTQHIDLNDLFATNKMYIDMLGCPFIFLIYQHFCWFHSLHRPKVRQISPAIKQSTFMGIRHLTSHNVEFASTILAQYVEFILDHKPALNKL